MYNTPEIGNIETLTEPRLRVVRVGRLNLAVTVQEIKARNEALRSRVSTTNSAEWFTPSYTAPTPEVSGPEALDTSGEISDLAKSARAITDTEAEPTDLMYQKWGNK